MKSILIHICLFAGVTVYAQTLQLPTAPSTSLTISSGTAAYSAATSVTAAGNNTTVNISGTANVSFVAGVQITLLPGFTAVAATGGSFQALIAPIVPTPTFTPGAGPSPPQMVSITVAPSGASIRYTTDGSTPSSTRKRVYRIDYR